MRSRLLINFCMCVLISLNGYANNHSDSIFNNVLDIRLEKDSVGIGLWIENITEDSLFLRSSFFIDNPSKISYVLVYYCNKEIDSKSDTIVCDFGYATEKHPFSVFIEFNNRKTVIKPYSKVFLPFYFPIKKNSTVYIKAQFVLIRKEEVIFIRKISNSIDL